MDLTTSSAGSSSDVAALQNQVTKLTELVEKLASDKNTKGERSRRRRRSATRSRSRVRRRGRARDVRDPSSEEKTPPRRRPRQPSCSPPRREEEQWEEQKEWTSSGYDNGWKVEKSWWNNFNEAPSGLSHYDARKMDPSKLTHEDLEWYVGDGFLGSNFKDKTSWIGAEDPSQNMTKGIRVVVRVRGCVNSTSTSFPRALSTWKKTTWIRARGGQGRAPGRWNLVEHMVPIGEASQLDDKFVHLVQFHFPDRAWSSSEKKMNMLE